MNGYLPNVLLKQQRTFWNFDGHERPYTATGIVLPWAGTRTLTASHSSLTASDELERHSVLVSAFHANANGGEMSFFYLPRISLDHGG